MKPRLLILVLWMLFLFGILLYPVAWQNVLPGPERITGFDKAAHIGLFAVTGFAIVFATTSRTRLRTRLLLAATAGVVLGAGAEISQHFIPHRTMDIYDFLADLVGLGLGLAVFSLLYRYRVVH